MQTKRRAFGRQHRLWAMALAVVLTCIPMVGTASAAPVTGAVILPEEAAPSPTVSIVGNVVVDKGKPTGFYELSLRVKTARTITKVVDGNVTKVEEAEYLAAIEADPDSANEYTITNYPFQSAAAAVWINLDALTAVTWESGKPIYSTWNATSSTGGTYIPDHANPTDAEKAKLNEYPRGIDTTNTDQPKIFTDLKLDQLAKGEVASVRLDAAHPDVMTNATALVEKVQGNYALLTLTANTTTTKNVVYSAETPVVVVRFAYDMNRFTKLDVGDTKVTPPEPNESSFWVGLDRRGTGSTGGPKTDQTALTWLAAGEPTMGDNWYAASDKDAADSSAQQAVWYAQNLVADDMTQQETHFYYYLGADGVNGGTTPAAQQGQQSYQVVDGTLKTPSLLVPKTEGKVVLAKKSAEYENPRDPETNEEYSFFQNLLEFNKTLKMYAENAETYRKPTGGGGTTILFYDWDDSLIGSLVVDKGDVRAEVNEYVETNLVHPDLRASNLLTNGKVPEEDDANRAAYTELVDSLARDYTYRGKYAYTVGDPDTVGENGDATNKARADGEDYPLTNKLDYAFYRHVNRVVEQEDATNHTKTNYYSTSSLLDANNADAALYPYVYGWAVVEDTTKTSNWKVMYDAAKTEDVWTTIGVGELSDVKPNAAGTALPGGLTIEDVTEPGFIAYETAKAIKKGEDVAVPTTYQYTTASNAANKYFRFADFSDIDSELARYQKANGGTKDTLVVKAVYEPGQSLMDGNKYRLITKPAYSKFNSQTASAGAAYRVQVTLERSYIHQGNVRGTSRMRLPEVQLTTTTDYKWLSSEDPEVDHDLENATLQTATRKTESTYIKVDVDNGEEITFNLSLSARMNKVEYVLVESYAANFVGGAQRSENNNSQTGEYFIPDNYNYLASDSVSPPGDDYYDCDYDTRSGSRGFVLLGTIGHMMENATQLRNGEITQLTFESAVSYTIAKDANLRVDPDKDITVSLADAAALREGIQNAELLCYQNRGTKDAPSAYDCWNWEFDCAQLTYHQLQLYLVNRTFLTKEDADAQSIDWCHLHSSCAEALSNKPKTWDDVIEAAAANDRDRLEKLTLTELEDLTYLRSNTNGASYTNLSTFITRLMAVVTPTSDNDWVSIQNRLLFGTGDKDTYWWYDGAKSNSVTSWNGLLAAVEPAIGTTAVYKDGEPVGQTMAKIEGARTIFNANASAYREGQNTATRNWNTLTHNLVPIHIEQTVNVGTEEEPVLEWQYNYVPYRDFETFRDALAAAVKSLNDASMDTSWEAIQYLLLFPDTTPAAMVSEPWTDVTLVNVDDWVYDPDTSPQAKQWPEGLWWKDGNVPLTVNNIASLLKAMSIKNDPASTPEDIKRADDALAKVSVDRLMGKEFWLRQSQTGEQWPPETPVKDILDTVQAAQAAGANNWNTLQYYLVHGNLASDPGTPGLEIMDIDKINQEARYYWWKNGGTGTSLDFTGTNMDTTLKILSEASLRGSQFGDPMAIQSVKEAAEAKDGYKDWLRLTTTPLEDTQVEGTTRDDLTHFADDDDGTDALLKEISDFAVYARQEQGLDIYARPRAMDWYQVQYWILNSDLPDEQRYITYGSDAYNEAKELYWWYDKEQKPEPEPPPPEWDPQPTDPLVQFFLEYIAEEVDVWDMQSMYTEEDFANWGLYLNSDGDPITDDDIQGDLPQWTDDGIWEFNAVGYLNGKIDITWAQLQVWYATYYSDGWGEVLSPEDALNRIVNEWEWTPKSEGGLIPDEIDLSILD